MELKLYFYQIYSISYEFLKFKLNLEIYLNNSKQKCHGVLFLWAETGRPKSETWASSPFSPPTARRPIPATSGVEVGQGAAGEGAWTKGNRWMVM